MTHPDLITMGRVLGDGEVPDGSSGATARDQHYTVIPSASAPRLLVPRGDRRVAAAAVRHTIVATSRQARLRQQALAGLFAVGWGSRSLGDMIFRDRMTVSASAPLSEFLSAQLGVEVYVSTRFGPQRANRKPVLQLLDAAGRCIAFVKVSVDGKTRELIRAETAALRSLAGQDLSPVRLPAVRYAGSWHDGAELLVVEALPVWLPGMTDPAARDEARLAAMRAVAHSAGTAPATLAGSAYLAGLSDRVDALGDHPQRPALVDVLGAARDFARPLDVGAWHGDWNNGNMAIRDGAVLLWDWERYAAGVPIGFDVLHFELARAVSARGLAPVEAVTEMRTRAAGLLAPFGITETDAAMVWTLYVAEIATRFLGDRQELGEARLGQVAGWLGPALRRD
jgi:hypothetical protein